MLSITAAAAAALVVGSAAQAASVTIHFDGIDGANSSIWYEDARGASNTGAEVSRSKLSPAFQNQMYNEALYRPVLPADLAGATINSATFTVTETDGNTNTMSVKLSRIDTLATWDPGNGTHATRWTFPDAGIQQYWADWDPTTGFDATSGTGVRWDGTVMSTPAVYNQPTNPKFAETAIGALVDTQSLTQGQSATFNVQGLVQNWANGTWDNDGFVLQAASATTTSSFFLSTAGTNGLVIDYTPIPEPASLSLLALGGLAMLRRRSR